MFGSANLIKDSYNSKLMRNFGVDKKIGGQGSDTEKHLRSSFKLFDPVKEEKCHD